MEGLLVQSSTWASLYAPTPRPANLSVETVEQPRDGGGLYKMAHVVATVVRVVGSVR